MQCTYYNQLIEPHITVAFIAKKFFWPIKAYQLCSTINLLSHCEHNISTLWIKITNWLTFQQLNTAVWCEILLNWHAIEVTNWLVEITKLFLQCKFGIAVLLYEVAGFQVIWSIFWQSLWSFITDITQGRVTK